MGEGNSSERSRLREIFLKAMDLSVPAERRAYLEQACQGNPVLLARVQALLENHTNDDFLENPAVLVTGAATKTVPYELPEEATEVIGPYKLLQKIGEGGCGVVYMAQQDEPVRRTVALKVIKLGMDTKQVIARFEAERQALAMMDHPNIAKVLGAGTTEKGRPYFVMELVRGIKITAYCDQNKLTPLVRLDLFMKVCQAIQHAHQKGIIHRDIKPSNILVTLHDGVPVPKVIDFGIAKATETRLTDKTLFTAFEQFIGTPAYMSPEQAEMSGLDIDTRADIYSLGVLLYELLTGKPPFDGKELVASGLEEMRRTIREREPLRPSVRLNTMLVGELTTTAQHRGSVALKLVSLVKGDLDWIVMKCLEKDRTRRYESASGLAADLKRYLDSEPVNARPPSSIYRLRKGLRRNRGVAIAAAVVLLALVGGIGLSTAALVREKQARLRQAAADRAKAAETVRADAVVGIVSELFATLSEKLDGRGHLRALRHMGEAADRLVYTALSNSPAAQVQVLHLVSQLVWEPDRKQLQRLDRIGELLPRVSDEDLPVSRAEIAEDREGVLLTLQGETGAEEIIRRQGQIEALRRQPRPDYAKIVKYLLFEIQCHYWLEQDELVEQRLSEAMRLLDKGVDEATASIVRKSYISALCTLGKYSEAEAIGCTFLRDAKLIDARMLDDYSRVVHHLAEALCGPGRFEDADRLFKEQAEGFKAAGHPPAEVYKLERRRAEVWARAFQPTRALPLLLADATNANAGTWEWCNAASVAVGVGDWEKYHVLCGIAIARYASGMEEDYMARIAAPLLLYPHDEVVTAVAAELVKRTEESNGIANLWAPHLRAWLEYRLGHFDAAHAALDKAASVPLMTPHYGRRFKPFIHADHYLRAILFAKASQVEQARASFDIGRRLIGPDPSSTKPRDLGDYFAAWYQAMAARREAEQVFREHGIPIPQLP